MKRISVLIFLTFTGLSVVLAQDIISLKTGGEMKARILRLNPKDVIFIPANSYDTAYLPRYEVSSLRYSTGIIIFLEEDQMPASVNEPENDSLFTLGKTDAAKYYKGYKPAAIATMIASIYFPFGVIPAIACSATHPSMKNLGYKDPKLMENPDYYAGYTKTSHTIKKKKVWSGFAIGSGFAILLVVFMSGVLVTAY